MTSQLKLFIFALVLFSSYMGTVNSAVAATLLLPSSTAFSILGASCGGIQEQTFASGFDSNGNVSGEVYLQTRCGGSGRGGGYTTHTYSSWVGVTWDLNGSVISDAVIAPPNPDPSIAGAYHSGGLVGGANFPNCNNTTPYDNAFTCSSNPMLNGSGTYSIENTLYVINQASCAASDTSYCTYRAIVSPAVVPVPSSAWLLGVSILGVAGLSRRKKTHC